MEWLFGKQKTVKEIIREQQRAINRSMLEIDREITKLQNTGKKLIIDIKKAARAGHQDTARILAKSLVWRNQSMRFLFFLFLSLILYFLSCILFSFKVQTRGQEKKLHQMKAQLQSVGITIQTMSSQQAVAEAMKGCATALRRMNRKIDVQGMQKIMMEFERQSGIMEMKDEMVKDVLEGMEDDPELEEEETENIINGVFEEIGLDITGKFVSAPLEPPPAVAAKAVAAPTPVEIGIGAPSSAPAPTSSSTVPSAAPAPAPSSSSVDYDSLQARFNALNQM